MPSTLLSQTSRRAFAPGITVTPAIQSGRRTVESALLALLAVAGVWLVRCRYESTLFFAVEVTTVMLLILTLAVTSRPSLRTSLAWVLVCWPILAALFGRSLGSPVAHEMAALTTFGTSSIALAMLTTSNRHRAMSVVGSGFLMLLTTCISDDKQAVFLAILWMVGCVWHLVANHWERLEVCMPDHIRRSAGVRPATVLLGFVLCIVVIGLVHGRAGQPNRFTAGFMPSSGGSRWSDPAARSGVGSGDAAIAARDHAESFGAVESELFLESTQSTLFDMFSDSIGQPKLKVKWERRQGMTPKKLIEAHGRTARSEQGSGNFSVSRTAPQKHSHLRDATAGAALQWTGPTGTRLAMHRYTHFDGIYWSPQSGQQNERLTRRVSGGQAWYFQPSQTRHVSGMSGNDVSVDQIKILRLNST
ncbi:MAG: transglutaminase domain-containing protein, partial [Pirellulales bacterium]|nr:transglutaminase domain-containing protein [Pirellulales bacterium]